MKALDLHRHMQQLGTWVDWTNTTDGFKFGPPDTDVAGIAVGWTSILAALQDAHDAGCNLFVTHEPTFYSHMDHEQLWFQTPPARQKIDFLRRTGMVVYRCHDVWDRVPQIGITDSWAAHLGLHEPRKKEGYHSLYRVAPLAAYEMAQRIANAVADLDQQAVQLLGPADKIVSHVAVGTGAATNVRVMREMGADVIVATDDGMRFWQHGTWAIDQDLPIIVVNHATAEAPGMRNLAVYLRNQFAPVKVEYVGPHCLYCVVPRPRGGPPQLAMIRPDLTDLPALQPPAGYRPEPLRPGQEWAYVHVMAESIYPGCRQDWFDRTFRSDPQYEPAHLILIWHGDQPAAAAAAWHDQLDDQPVGVVHMVGGVPAHRGRGLGSLVTLAALHRLRQRGFDRALLYTDDWRVPAIKAYLRLGFEPLHRHDSHPARWQAVMQRIQALAPQAKPPG